MLYHFFVYLSHSDRYKINSKVVLMSLILMIMNVEHMSEGLEGIGRYY